MEQRTVARWPLPRPATEVAGYPRQSGPSAAPGIRAGGLGEDSPRLQSPGPSVAARPRQALDATPDELPALLTELGQPAYRGRQLAGWLFGRVARSYDEMSDLPLALRRQLAERLPLAAPQVIDSRRSADGGTEKVLLRLADGAAIETVLMRQPARDGVRNTICLSTQVGCAIGCPFCATGQAGWVRNLSSGEIIAQVAHWRRVLQAEGATLDNVVYMGMGEPLGNYAATLRSIAVLNHPEGFGLGARHITVSTSGLAPQIERLAQEPYQINLAVSLHAANDALRDSMVPINCTYPLDRLLAAVRHYIARTNRRVSFEYVLLAGVNDAPEQAEELAALLRDLLCHVNLIPLNPEPSGAFSVPRQEAINRFAAIVRERRLPCTVRVDRGQDIAAACGQLARQQRGMTRPLLPEAGSP
jgi:23S rRNA (adenine2503-C2)-methyltransferase